MPAMDSKWWTDRLDLDAPCHYLNDAADWYAWQVRTAGIKRVWPAELDSYRSRVLDVGCGDGRYSKWMAEEFGVTVDGTDAFMYQSVRDRVDAFYQHDGEELAYRFKPGRYDMAVALTSFCCMQDWKKTAEALATFTSRILVVENTQSPTPPWQKNHHQKHHIESRELLHGMADLGYYLIDWTAVNLIDRAWMVHAPDKLRWPVAWATQAVDRLLAPRASLERARYTAILFERGEIV